MRTALIGCVKSSEMALKILSDIDNVELCGVVTKSKSAMNADFVDLTSWCKDSNTPYYFYDNSSAEGMKHFLSELSLDVIFCIGWSHLIEESVLHCAKYGVIGFHPAKLPENRGRHPLIWALTLGLEETASTFFRIDSGTDSGDIVSQKLVKIDSRDTAKELYERVLVSAQQQLIDIINRLDNQSLTYTAQDPSKATYWRKRSRADGIIDFRMSAEAIYNLVRALAPPYPCAEILTKGAYLKVIQAEVDESCVSRNIEHGKVLAVEGRWVTVKAYGNNAVRLKLATPHNLTEGSYL